jgi:hypothetical protein
MNAQLSLFLDNNKEPNLSVLTEKGEEQFVLYPRVCENPLCPCTDIDCTLISRGDTCESMRFVVDWKKRCAVEKPGVTEQSRRMLEILLGADDARFWRQLAWLFYGKKHPLCESFRLDCDDYAVPVVKPGTRLSYCTLVPHAEELKITVGKGSNSNPEDKITNSITAMPTKKRITIPGAIAHVMGRGIDGQRILQ